MAQPQQEQQTNLIIMIFIEWSQINEQTECTFVQHISKLLTKIHNMQFNVTLQVHNKYK